MQAVILAAGKGERLDPFTVTRPKPVLPLANRPLVGLLAEFLGEAGCEEVIVVTGYKAEMVEDTLGDGSAFGVRVVYVRQSDLLGPIHGLLEARELLAGPFLAVCGDCFIRPEAIHEALAVHRTADALCTLAVGPSSRPLYHEQAISDADGRLQGIRDIAGDRQRDEDDLVAGLCVADAGIWQWAEKFVAAEPDEWARFFAWLAQTQPVQIARSDHEFIDLDYPWEIRDGAVKAYLYATTEASVSENALIEPVVKIEGRVVIEDGVFIEQGSVVKNAWIGQGTRVLANSYINGAFIGRECTIGPQCYVGGTVGHNSKIGYTTEYGALALGRVGFWHQCHISGVWGEGSGATPSCSTTERRGGIVKVRVGDQLISSGLESLGAFIGDHSSLNTGAKVMPGRKIGPHSVAGPNVIVYRDIPPRVHVVARQELEIRDR
ncbi:MAG: sugar phosphate nucleotidyltransferase [Candidatus Latescibacteria bacterium]|jgi:NDP-sugar pyrophosphorylase family protein|nr:sugar phosphate nucleotidyltransferase [Candidatus Latescibacterota bacterium]